MFNPFTKKPTVSELATKELYEAQVNLQEALTALEWATSIVNYNKIRVARLTEQLNKAP